MAMYVCDVCGCLENSSNGNWWFRFRDDDGVAKCSMCAYGEWRSQFARRPWDGISKVENRTPITGQALKEHTESLFNPDEWLKDFVHVDDAVAGCLGVRVPRPDYDLYVSCNNGIQVDVRRLCNTTIILHKEHTAAKIGPRAYFQAKLSISDLSKVYRNCKFNVRDLTVTPMLIGGPSEEDHYRLYQQLTSGYVLKLADQDSSKI